MDWRPAGKPGKFKPMNDREQLNQLTGELFARKSERRRELAALPVEQKFEILLRLQQLASDVALAAGRPAPSPWKTSSRLGFTSSPST